MIRTAILAAMLLVMLSMAYSRTGQLPDLRTAQEPAKVEPKPEPQVAALSEPAAPPALPSASPRTQITVRPGIDPASPMTPIHATIAKTRAAPPPAEVAAAPAPVAPLAPAAVPQVAPIAPVAEVQPAPVAAAPPAPVVAPQPAPAVPVAAAPVLAKAAPAPVQLAPKVEEAPADPVVAVPAEPVIAKVTPVDEMPVKQVATPRVMMPRDLPLPSEPPVAKIAPRTVAAADMMDDGFPAPPPGSNAAPAQSAKDSAAKKPADAPQFMSREERTRELYRLAREMEDTFISKLAR